jgi:hypothetical protein
MIESIAELQDAGRLADAEEAARAALQQPGLSADATAALRYEIERTRRIRMDYSVTRERLLKRLEENLRDFTPAEFDRWVGEGRLDRKLIDGEERFVGSSYANLFHRYRELHARRVKPADVTWETFLAAHVEQLLKESAATGAVDTLQPRRFRITMKNRVLADTVPAGETIRCWMVYPQQFKAQSDVVLEAATPTPKWINAPDYPQRSLYFEQPSAGAEDTHFTATYRVTTYPRRVRIDPAVVASTTQGSHPEAAWFLREQPPHVQFTPAIKALAEEITGSETNPATKARLLYDWMAENMRYSFAREYSTLHNISAYCLENRYGDCGQLALLYIALCRASGIPARWQSGWVIYPEFQNLHDWTEILLEPYGWVPVDPNYGIIPGTPDAAHLTPEQRATMRDFFFGGLDAYRLIINRDHGYPHFPTKEDFRSDPVDFQRGEFESGGKNIYFDRFRYGMDLEVLEDPAPGEASSSRSGRNGHALLAPGMVR